MAPVAFVERRVAEHDIGRALVVGVGAQGVGGRRADGRVGVQGEAQRGEGGQFGHAVLAVQALVGAGRDGAQQGAGAAGGVEDGARGGRARGEFGHEGGGSRRGQRVLAGVGVGLPAEQELVRAPGAEFGRQLRDAAQQRDGRQEFGGVGDAYGPSAPRPEPLGHDVFELGGQELGQPFVRHGAEREPGRRPVADQEQGAARVQQGGDGSRGVPGELLPDAFTQRHLDELALGAQPALDVGEREGGAGLRATHGLGEVPVPAAPVADGGASHSGQPGDPGGGHLGRVVPRLHAAAPLVARGQSRAVEHIQTIIRTAGFTAVDRRFTCTRVDSVHRHLL